MTKNDVIRYILENNLSISKEQILISLLIAMLLGLLIYFVYRKTYVGTAYSREFGQSLVYITIITTLIMTVIQSNLALSLGMVGSLSIIRFRTAIKSPKDVSFVFWSVSEGVACGSSLFLPGIIGAVIIGALSLAFCKNIYDKTAYLLTVSMQGGMDFSPLEKEIKKYSKRYMLKLSQISKDEARYTYELSVQSPQANMLVKAIGELDEVIEANIVSFAGEAI